MLVPIIAGLGAALFVALTEKKPESKEAPKTFDDGLKAGREAADKEHKARAADRRRIEKIVEAKQALLGSRGRSKPVTPTGDDDGGGEE